MKRKIIITTLLLALISIISVGSLAYFSAEKEAHNVITSGSVEIELEELTNQTDKQGQPIPFEDVDGVMPGTSTSKIVQIKNTGKNEAFIRLNVTKDILLQDGFQGDVDLDLIIIDFNTEEWTLGKGGYYYYNQALAVGATTTPLFTTITFDKTMGNLYQNSSATVDVKAFAVQTAHNGATVFDAVGWPVG